MPEIEPLLTPAEVGATFRCDPKTIARWAKQGKLTAYRTPGGHRRYKEAEVRALLERDDPGPLDSPVSVLWAATVTGTPATVKRKLSAAQVRTVGQLCDHTADALAAIGIRGPALDAVRLALAKRGLTLHGEILATKVA